MDKKVRFEEIARGKLINIAPQPAFGQRELSPVRPRKKARRSHYFQNKIVLEPTDELMPVRMRAKPMGLWTLMKLVVQGPKAQAKYRPRPIAKAPVMPADLSDQRVVFPEPSRRPKTPVTVKIQWSEVDGAWNTRRSSLGLICDRVANKPRQSKMT